MTATKLIVSLCLLALPMLAADDSATPARKTEKPVNFIPAKADALVGDWQGKGDYVAQVFATSDGKYGANLLSAFDTESNLVATLQGTSDGGGITFSGDGWTGQIKESHLLASNGDKKVDLQHIIRTSPTVGAKAPAGAIVLFDGRNLDAWAKKNGKSWLMEDGPAKWKLVGDGAVEVVPETDCIITHQKFGDCHVHVEFRTLGAPSNSGVFLEDRYEVNINETYGRTSGTPNGGFDNCTDHVEPRLRPSFPPLAWQTFDIDFQAPRFDAGGNKTANARATVLLNGVKIYDKQELDLPHGAAARLGEASTGPLMLQEHGMPVQFRNIWLVETK
jgi:hypothetical protein